MISREEVRTIKAKLALANFLPLFFLLFFSETFNSLNNNKLDSLSYNFIQRIEFSFKPLALMLYAVISIILYAIILHYLKPFFNFLSKNEDYDKARIASLKLPWVILIFQSIAWGIGTTAYYIIKNFEPDSGIPYQIGIFLKLGAGFISSAYIAVFINIIISKYKSLLNVNQIKEGENDSFARNKDYIFGLISLFYLCINMVYLCYYYLNIKGEHNEPMFMINIFVFPVLLIFFAMGLTFLSKKENKQQIEFLKDKIKEISKGDADLTRQIPIINFDEFGDISAQVNIFINKLKEIVNKVKLSSVDTSNNGKILCSSVNESQEAIQKISKRVKDIAEVITTQTLSVSDMSSVVEELLEKTSTLSTIVARQFENVSESSASIGSMISSISLVKDATEEMDREFSLLTNSAQKNKEMVDNVGELLKTISSNSEKLLGINSVIKKISAQTNLLAMNAAIEAAHAGDAGRGFAVVSDEIRTLSETSSRQSKEINSTLKLIKNDIDKIVESIKLIINSFGDTIKLVSKANELQSSIKKSMLEQSDEGKQILELLSNIDKITSEVKDGSIEMSSGSNQIFAEVNKLEQINSAIQEKIKEILTEVEKLTKKVESMHEVSCKTEKNITVTQEQISSFKTS